MSWYVDGHGDAFWLDEPDDKLCQETMQQQLQRRLAERDQAKETSP